MIKRIIEVYVPITTCTLRCSYCYITMKRLFDGPIPKVSFTPEFFRKALSKERLGGSCLIGFCAGGETLLLPHLIDYIRVLLEEGHYVQVVTNGTISKRFDEFAQLPPDLTAHLFFKFSYHYTQLKERNLLEGFFANIKKVKDAGCSFTLEQVPSDDTISCQDEAIKLAQKYVGATPHITVARDEHRIGGKLPIYTQQTRGEYKKTWGDKYNSALFDYKLSIFEQPRKEFCYAGDWSFTMDFCSGLMRQCYSSKTISRNIYKNIEKPIHFCAVGHHCPEPHCYNGHLFLSFGDIPEVPAPKHADLRNRICADGTEWLQPEMKAFMNSKLYETNKEYSKIKKALVDFENVITPVYFKVAKPFVKIKKMLLKKK